MLALSASCVNPENGEAENNLYFNVKGLLDGQIVMMDSLKPSLVKKAVLKGDPDHSTFQPDSAAWARELELFYELDLNKTSLRDKYKIERTFQEDFAQQAIVYSSLDEEETAVDQVKIVFEHGQPRLLEGVYNSKSPLFNSRRNLSIWFAPLDSVNVISAYAISGAQKMVWTDTVYFEIEGKLAYPGHEGASNH